MASASCALATPVPDAAPPVPDAKGQHRRMILALGAVTWCIVATRGTPPERGITQRFLPQVRDAASVIVWNAGLFRNRQGSCSN